MRLRTFVAPDARQAMARLRAELGEDAIIVATQELADGEVRITGAIEKEDLDLAELLAPALASPCTERLQAVAAHHELPEELGGRLFDAARRASAGQPAVALAQALSEIFRFEPFGTAPEGALLLTGPPGAGKTASIAKLAAAAVLDGRPVTVLTADATRAGGLEQLAALLAPLELRPEPAPEPAILRRLVADAGATTLLIDSPGLNPFRPADLGALSSLLEASRAEPVLVLPAGLGVADCAEIGQIYRALGARRMLATKLDAARRLGGLLAAADAGLAFAEAGIGPTIGQGLSPLSPGGLARLLLHHQEAAGSPCVGGLSPAYPTGASVPGFRARGSGPAPEVGAAAQARSPRPARSGARR
jgi:flagellar biosynthesis protein FlhF